MRLLAAVRGHSKGDTTILLQQNECMKSLQDEASGASLWRGQKGTGLTTPEIYTNMLKIYTSPMKRLSFWKLYRGVAVDWTQRWGARPGGGKSVGEGVDQARCHLVIDVKHSLMHI